MKHTIVRSILSPEQFFIWDANFKKVLDEEEAAAYANMTIRKFRETISPYLRPHEITKQSRFYDKTELENYLRGCI